MMFVLFIVPAGDAQLRAHTHRLNSLFKSLF